MGEDGARKEVEKVTFVEAVLMYAVVLPIGAVAGVTIRYFQEREERK